MPLLATTVASSAPVRTTIAGIRPPITGRSAISPASASSETSSTSTCPAAPRQPWRRSYSSTALRSATSAARCRRLSTVVTTWKPSE